MDSSESEESEEEEFLLRSRFTLSLTVFYKFDYVKSELNLEMEGKLRVLLDIWLSLSWLELHIWLEWECGHRRYPTPIDPSHSLIIEKNSQISKVAIGNKLEFYTQL